MTEQCSLSAAERAGDDGDGRTRLHGLNLILFENSERGAKTRLARPLASLKALLPISQNGNILLASEKAPCDFMRVISRKPLNDLAKRHPEAKAELDAWFHETEAATWLNPAEIKADYGNASILKK